MTTRLVNPSIRASIDGIRKLTTQIEFVAMEVENSDIENTISIELADLYEKAKSVVNTIYGPLGA